MILSNINIRKNGLLIFMAIAVIFPAASQITFNAGLSIGANTTQVQGDGYAGFNKLGVRAGGWANVQLSDNDFIEFQILYSQKGSKKPPYPKIGDYTIKIIRIDYIEVPVMYKRKIGNFIYQGGLTLANLIREQYFDESGEYTPSTKFLPFELGYLLGAQYSLNDHVSAFAGFGGSILSVRDIGAYQPEIGVLNNWRKGTYNLWIAFSINYQFGKAKS